MEEASLMPDVWVKVVEVKGECPVHKVGDRFVIRRGFRLDSLGGEVCLHALCGMSSLIWALGHGHDPDALGLGQPPRLTCPDPGPPLSRGGTVIFELSVSEEE
ncbi:MAG TPA: TIGR04076 family protein [Candidatus Korarchaeota archaeon]|nr:TIGR04076 family protein [Candidatus Korarchaeota archaeon]